MHNQCKFVLTHLIQLSSKIMGYTYTRIIVIVSLNNFVDILFMRSIICTFYLFCVGNFYFF